MVLDWKFKPALMSSSRELLNERRWLVKGALIIDDSQLQETYEIHNKIQLNVLCFPLMKSGVEGGVENTGSILAPAAKVHIAWQSRQYQSSTLV